MKSRLTLLLLHGPNQENLQLYKWWYLNANRQDSFELKQTDQTLSNSKFTEKEKTKTEREKKKKKDVWRISNTPAEVQEKSMSS